MVVLTTTQKKALEIYHNDGHVKAWNYWKLMGNTYGIFLGEVPSIEFIDGESLANHIGLTEGKLRNIDTPWLKFILDGNIIYVAKKPLMHSVSWDAINECGAVFEDEGASITIDNNDYDITLLHGGVKSLVRYTDYNGYDIDYTHSSEWNRLMYPIHSGIHLGNLNPSSPSVLYSQWASYCDNDLLIHKNFGIGSASWTLESFKHDGWSFLRGYNGVTYSCVSSSTARKGSSHGWRPALRIHLT